MCELLQGSCPYLSQGCVSPQGASRHIGTDVSNPLSTELPRFHLALSTDVLHPEARTNASWVDRSLACCVKAVMYSLSSHSDVFRYHFRRGQPIAGDIVHHVGYNPNRPSAGAYPFQARLHALRNDISVFMVNNGTILVATIPWKLARTKLIWSLRLRFRIIWSKSSAGRGTDWPGFAR